MRADRNKWVEHRAQQGLGNYSPWSHRGEHVTYLCPDYRLHRGARIQYIQAIVISRTRFPNANRCPILAQPGPSRGLMWRAEHKEDSLYLKFRLTMELYTNYQDWEAIKMPSLGKCMNKLHYIHGMEYYAVITSKLPPYKKTWKNFKFIFLHEKAIWKDHTLYSN